MAEKLLQNAEQLSSGNFGSTTEPFCNPHNSLFAMPKQIDWEAIRKYWQQTGASSQAIADQFGVSKRSVDERLPKWRETEKSAQKVVPIAEAKAKAKSVNTDPTPYRNPPSVRRQKSQVDEVEIVENAIVSLDSLLSCCSPEDTRGVGGIAGALVKLLEYRRKIQPPTAAELAEQAIALDLRPDEFMQALRDAWRLRA